MTPPTPASALQARWHALAPREQNLVLAAAALVRRMRATVFEAAAIIDLPELGGSQKLEDAGIPTFCLTNFALSDR